MNFFDTSRYALQQETGLCKNLLQEYAQKMNFAIPSYVCTKQASGIAPFICTVEIGGIQYIGATARTKKEAEIKAARTALLAIQGNYFYPVQGHSLCKFIQPFWCWLEVGS
jgi:dsRNA-specific ribonuclease